MSGIVNFWLFAAIFLLSTAPVWFIVIAEAYYACRHPGKRRVYSGDDLGPF